MGRCGWLDWPRRVPAGDQTVRSTGFSSVSSLVGKIHVERTDMKNGPIVSFLYARTLPGKHLEQIAEQIRINNINALLVIGGFEVCKFTFILDFTNILLGCEFSVNS